MLKVKFKVTYAGTEEYYEAGKVYEVSKDFAHRLLAAGDAEVVVPASTAKTANIKK